MPAPLEKEIAELIERIDQHPDKLHGDHTPAVGRLIEIGRPALGRVLELMLNENRDTRLRALRVIETVTMGLAGFRLGQGWSSAADERTWRDQWSAMGSLTADAPMTKRAESVAKWRQWLGAHPPAGPVEGANP